VSDLQCAAHFIVVSSIDDELAQSLGDERVAAVYDARRPPDRGPRGAVEELAGRLGLPVLAADGRLLVEDLRSAAPTAMGVLVPLADLHRGETVLVHAAGSPGTRLDVRLDGDGMVVDG
jgi:hypothetical protein